MFIERSWTSNTEETLMLTEQMKDDLRKATWTWKKPAIPFTGLLGRTMESRPHYQPRLKVLNGFRLLHSMRAVRLAQQLSVELMDERNTPESEARQQRNLVSARTVRQSRP
jgi:hypothetical protein